MEIVQRRREDTRMYSPRMYAIMQGPQTTFFLENALKKITEHLFKFLFLFESTILPSS